MTSFVLLTMLAVGQTVAVPVTGKPAGLAAGDYNGDGNKDLVVGCEKEIAILLGDGRGGFREVSRTPMPRRPSELAVADFDNDGKLDLAVADHDTFAIVILAGDGRGGLRQAATIRAKQTGRPHIHGLLTGDWNRDDKADLILASVDEGELIVLTGDGQGGFVTSLTIPVATPQNPATADVNHDGIADLVVPGIRSGQLRVLLGNGKGSFADAPGSPHTVLPRPFHAAVSDLNGDGHADIVATHDDVDQLSVFSGDGKGGFRQLPESPLDVKRRVYFTGVVDLNGDGRMEIVAAGGAAIATAEQNNDGRFAAAEPIPLDAEWNLLIADFNNDGKSDLAIAQPKANRVTVRLTPSTR